MIDNIYNFIRQKENWQLVNKKIQKNTKNKQLNQKKQN